ncbi:MAG: NYN domain-containing protein [Acidimicrobiales bacterium]
MGRFQEKNLTCRSCGGSWKAYEEKETDVSIAVSMVEDAALGRFDTALLVSADSDLCPAIRSVRRVRPGARVVAVFPPKRRSDELRQVADASFTLGHATIRRSLLPSSVRATSGQVFTRPRRW